MAEDHELPEDIEELISIDPLGVASEMAAIISYVGEAEILDVEAKQDCLNDCLNVIYKCNSIIKQQLIEQYSFYLKPKKKNGKASSKVRNEDEQQAADGVAE